MKVNFLLFIGRKMAKSWRPFASHKRLCLKIKYRNVAFDKLKILMFFKFEKIYLDNHVSFYFMISNLQNLKRNNFNFLDNTE
jgi:hypothetical protein